jgi:hypothetical protein
MAIAPSQLRFERDDGTVLKNGSLHQLLGARRVGSSTDYAFLVVRNTHPTLTLSTVKAWLYSPKGAAVAIGYANAPIAGTADFDDVAYSSPTYSSPTSKAAGIALADLGPGQKLRLVVRRTFTSAVTVSPQTARVFVGGTSPI